MLPVLHEEIMDVGLIRWDLRMVCYAFSLPDSEPGGFLRAGYPGSSFSLIRLARILLNFIEDFLG
jgi:hypothetical protein